ncbi:hypothetical protein [Dyella sp. EPa41]|uniref:hypothetical protein n=1 Tax=Dyella sp. EPa41 TaxID=1561194 RepID=UPI0019156663|nr:hypothetical protein [Dyella sp. EPa41]
MSSRRALRRTIVAIRHHRAATEALFRYLGPAHRRRPQRLDPGAVDAGGEEQVVVDLLQDFLVLRIEDVAVLVFHHHAQRIAQAAQLARVVQVVADIGMVARNHLLEAGVEVQPRRRQPPKGHRGDHARHDHDEAVIEHQSLQQVAGALVESLDGAHDGHAIDRLG